MTLTTFSTSQEAQQAAALLVGYRFDLGSHDARQWVSLWLDIYRPVWIRDAVIESLYQGRYKALSVRQILDLWQKRGNPIRHANREFEVTICQDYGGHRLPTAKARTAKKTPAAHQLNQPSHRPLHGSSHKTANEHARQRASRRIHQSLSSISFNIADQLDDPSADSSVTQSNFSEGSTDSAPFSHPSTVRSAVSEAAVSEAVSRKVSHIEHPPKRVLIETAEMLQAQRQRNRVSYASPRAIQPFKPALPFSAQTLRLAKQKVFASTK